MDELEGMNLKKVIPQIFYILYLIAIVQRKIFLPKGTRYDGEIIDTQFSSFKTTLYVRFKIRYNGNQTFITPKFDYDSVYRIASNNCGVYVYHGKCYASDFVLENIKEMESPSLPVETIEKYLVDAINGPGFDKMEFIRGRVRVALHGVEGLFIVRMS